MPPLSDRLAHMIDRFRCRDGDPEIVAILFTDRHARIIETRILDGLPDRVDLPMGPILRQSRALRADRLLMLHTHPSGNPHPSPRDLSATRQLCARLRRQGQRLADHIILTQDRYFSFRANRML